MKHKTISNLLLPELLQLSVCVWHQLFWHSKEPPAGNKSAQLSIKQLLKKVLVLFHDPKVYLAYATITTRRCGKNNSFASSNLCRLAERETIWEVLNSESLQSVQLRGLSRGKHTTASINADEGKTAVPPGTYSPTELMHLVILLHLTPFIYSWNGHI